MNAEMDSSIADQKPRIHSPLVIGVGYLARFGLLLLAIMMLIPPFRSDPSEVDRPLLALLFGEFGLLLSRLVDYYFRRTTIISTVMDLFLYALLLFVIHERVG